MKTGEEIKYEATVDMDWLEYFDDLVNNVWSNDAPVDERINKVSSSQFTIKQVQA